MMTLLKRWRRKEPMNRRTKVLGKFVEVSKEPMRRSGKLFVLFVGAEHCPFCAAERWAIVRALQKFGQWSDLTQTISAARDEPFLLVVGRFMQLVAGFTPKIFIGHTFRQTETELKKAESEIRKTIDAEGNIIAALLCVSGLPHELCKETGVAELVAQATTKLAA